MDYTVKILFSPTEIASDKFTLINGTEFTDPEIEIERLNGYKKVDQINENSIWVDSNGKCSIGYSMDWEDQEADLDSNQSILDDLLFTLALNKKVRLGQTFDFSLVRLSGDAVSFYIRTTPTDFRNGGNYKLTFIENEFILFDKDEEIKQGKLSEFEPNESYRIIIQNNSKKIKVSYDCDEILSINTDFPITDYLILHNEGLKPVELNALSINKSIPKYILE